VFLFMEDHGSPGAFYFPGFVPMYAADFMAAMQHMSDTWMYSRMVVYLTACESGSMFAGILPPNISIYATSASPPDTSAYVTFCSPYDLINGKNSGINGTWNCLASEFGIAFLNATDSFGMTQSWQQQFDDINSTMVLSSPEQYGDLSWTGSPIGLVFTDMTDAAGRTRTLHDGRLHVSRPEDSGMTSMQPGWYEMTSAQWSLDHAAPGSQQWQQAKAEIAAMTQQRHQVDALFEQWAGRAFAVAGLKLETSGLASLQESPYTPIVHTLCMRDVDTAILEACGGYTDYSRKYAGLVINTCRTVAAAAPEAELELPALMAELCTAKPMLVAAA